MQEESKSKDIIETCISLVYRGFSWTKQTFGKMYLLDHHFYLTVCPSVHIKLENRRIHFYDILCCEGY
jgi:hypothetical protein